MLRALELAREAAAAGEVPVGAVVVRGEDLLGEGRNCREAEADALCHAELLAISQACRKLHSWRLDVYKRQSYSSLQKNLGRFRFSVSGGKIHVSSRILAAGTNSASHFDLGGM